MKVAKKYRHDEEVQGNVNGHAFQKASDNRHQVIIQEVFRAGRVLGLVGVASVFVNLIWGY